MFTASIIRKELTQGTLHLTIEFSDGTTSFTENFPVRSAEDGWIEGVVAARLKELENLKTLASETQLGAIDVAAEPVEPTDDGVAAFIDAYRDVQRMKNAHDLGFVGQAGVDQAIKNAQSLYKPGFFQYCN